MTDSKLEQVARAICLSFDFNPLERLACGEEVIWRWEAYLPAARAALDAVEEPTEGMLEAAWQATRNATPEQHMAYQLGDQRQSHILKMRHRYAAMIRAAKGD